MRVPRNVAALALTLVLGTACGGRSSEEDGGPSGSAGTDSETGGSSAGGSGATAGTSSAGTSVGGWGGGESDAGSVFYLYDENNYRTQTSLSIPTVETASGVDIDVCWSDLVSDLDCNPVEPQADMDAIGFFRFQGLPEEEIAALFAAGELDMSDLDGYLSFESDHASTCTTLSSFSNFGTQVDVTEAYTESDDLSYLFMFTRGSTPGVGSLSMVFGRPVAASMNTTLDAPPGCGLREFSPSLASTAPVPVSPNGPWTADWSNVTRDGAGNPIQFSSIDGLSLWFVAGATPAEVESQITELDRVATATFHLELTGEQRADLANARSLTTAEPFSDFRHSEDGTWILALTCGDCIQPVPLVLVVLEPAR